MKALKITTVVLVLGLVGLAVYVVTSCPDETKVEYDARANCLYESRGSGPVCTQALNAVRNQHICI